MKALLRHPRLLPALLALLALLVVSGLLAWKLGLSIAVLKDWVAAVVAYLQERPVLLFVAIAVLPSLPFPVSVLLLAAGVVYGERFGLVGASLIALAAMTINLSWTYWLARSPARRLLGWLVKRFNVAIPELPERHWLRFAIALRITPGIPFFLQNYVLGLARIPFRIYFVVSVLAQTMWTFGFVMSAGAIFEGKAGLAVAGTCVLILAAIATQFVRRRLSTSRDMET